MAKDTKSEGVVLDFGDVKPFEPLDGSTVYLTVVSKFEPAKAKKSGQDMSHLELTILEPEEVPVEEWIPDDEADGGFRKGEGIVVNEKTGEARMTKAKGRKLFRELSHEAKALPFMYEFIKAAMPKVNLDSTFKVEHKKYVGLQVAVKVQNRAFEEQVRSGVKRILPVSAYKPAR